MSFCATSKHPPPIHTLTFVCNRVVWLRARARLFFIYFYSGVVSGVLRHVQISVPRIRHEPHGARGLSGLVHGLPFAAPPRGRPTAVAGRMMIAPPPRCLRRSSLFRFSSFFSFFFSHFLLVGGWGEDASGRKSAKQTSLEITGP